MPSTFLKYAAHAPEQADLRDQHIREALDDPEILATLNPVFAIARLRKVIEQALTPRPVPLPGRRSSVAEEDARAEDVAWVTEPEVAIKAVAELRAWLPYVMIGDTEPV